MKQFKGDRLYVKLGASQVRRRLKGLGFGVKKVESAGRGRAAIIHTATGQHLRELAALFQDASAALPAPEGHSADPRSWCRCRPTVATTRPHCKSTLGSELIQVR